MLSAVAREIQMIFSFFVEITEKFRTLFSDVCVLFAPRIDRQIQHVSAVDTSNLPHKIIDIFSEKQILEIQIVIEHHIYFSKAMSNAK